MATNDGLRKYVEAGAVLGHVTRARAEEIMRELVNAGELQRDQASEWVDDLVERSRKASEELVAIVRREVENQLRSLSVNPDQLAKQVAEILKHSADVGRTATSHAATRAGSTAKAARQAADRVAKSRSGAKTPAMKSPAKKAAATSSGEKKTVPKKTVPKKTVPK